MRSVIHETCRREAHPWAIFLAVALGLPGAASGEIHFREASSDWGLQFQHHHGGSGRYYQPETDGSGVAIFDYDGDGDEDVFIVDGGAFPGYEGETPRSRLFRNELADDAGSEGARFVDVTDSSGLEITGFGMGATAGDVDSDGDLDLFVTAWRANQLFRNNGDGTFSDITAAAGLGDERWNASAAFGDMDRDGDLDLYVTGYLVWSMEQHSPCEDPKTGQIGYCHPGLLMGEPDRFYRNQGDGTFVDDTEAAGLGGADGKGLGVTLADFDEDGWSDIYVANDTTANFFYRNRGDGTFEDLSLLSGTAFSDNAMPEAGMGIAVGDIWGDGHLDIYVTNYALETNALYRNIGGGLFVDARHMAGVSEPSIRDLGFGTAFADFDNDGDLDLAVANGHVIDSIDRLHPPLTYAQRNQILEQVRPGRFSLVTESGVEAVRVSRGLAVGDLDADGDLDLVITNSNDAAEAYENVSTNGRWLAVDLLAAEGNRDAIGGSVSVQAAGTRQVAEVVTGTSYLSQHSLTLHFGVMHAPAAMVEIVWPDRTRRRIHEMPTNHRLVFKDK